MCTLSITINRECISENRESPILVLEGFSRKLVACSTIASAPNDVAVDICSDKPDVTSLAIIRIVIEISEMIPCSFDIPVVRFAVTNQEKTVF